MADNPHLLRIHYMYEYIAIPSFFPPLLSDIHVTYFLSYSSWQNWSWLGFQLSVWLAPQIELAEQMERRAVGLLLQLRGKLSRLDCN